MDIICTTTWEKARWLNITKTCVLGIVLLASCPCLCLAYLVFAHNSYHPISDLSSTDNEEKVQALLEKELTIHQSTKEDVLAIMEKYHVDNCQVLGTDALTYDLRCSIPKHYPIRGLGDLENIFARADYFLSFSFKDSKLSGIDVELVPGAI